MPPKKVVKAPAKGEKASTHLAAAAAAAASSSSTTTTNATTTIAAAAATVVASCEPRNISNRTLEYEAKGIPWFIGTMRENFNQALCRAEKSVKRSKEWRDANPAKKKAMVKAARSQKEQEMGRRFDWRDAARNMGFRAKGDSFLWREGCPIYGTAGASDPTEEEEELPFSLPDDEPTIKKRRRDDDDEDEDEDDPNGDYTKRYMSCSIPRQVRIKPPPLSGQSTDIQRSILIFHIARLSCRRLLRCSAVFASLIDLNNGPRIQSSANLQSKKFRSPWRPAPLCLPWTVAAAAVLSFLLALHKAAGGRNIWTCLLIAKSLARQKQKL
ncbi:hypothetical protein EAF00_005091 [Botryotinia globosa]|nr:hypothetical protein EAF00_005091 [Botryotinia globosa]